jgi:hypothetical protein
MAALVWADAKGALAQKFALQIPAINNGSVGLQHPSQPSLFPLVAFCLAPLSSLGHSSSCKIADT